MEASEPALKRGRRCSEQPLAPACAESRRAAHMRTVVAAATALNHALASQIRCMLVNCQGSHGAGDLARETEELHAALMQYAELVHDVGRDRERILTGVATEVVKSQETSEPRIPRGKPALRRAV